MSGDVDWVLVALVAWPVLVVVAAVVVTVAHLLDRSWRR